MGVGAEGRGRWCRGRGKPITEGAYDLGVGSGGRREVGRGRGKPITEGAYDLGVGAGGRREGGAGGGGWLQQEEVSKTDTPLLILNSAQ